MSDTFHQILSDLESIAAEVIDDAKAAGIEIVQEVGPLVETAFVQILSAWGQVAIAAVVDLMSGETAKLSGSEKANLAATTVVQAAEAKGVTIAANHVSALIETAFTVVAGKLNQLSAGLSPST